MSEIAPETPPNTTLEVSRLLTEIGFSAKESIVFECLLRFGPKPIGFLHRKTKMPRGSLYSLITNLEGRGLICRSQKNSVSIYGAIEPSELLNHFQERIAEFKKIEANLTKAIPVLSSLRLNAKSEQEVKILSGNLGARSLLLELIKDQGEIKAFGSRTLLHQLCVEYQSKEIIRGITYALESESNALILVTRKRIGIFTEQDSKIGVVIESRPLIELFAGIFAFLK